MDRHRAGVEVDMPDDVVDEGDENLVRAVEAELWFYGHVLGFEPADDIDPVEMING